MKSFVKSMAPSPPLFWQENAFEKYQFSNNSCKIYLCVCVCVFFLHFQSRGRWFWEMLFCMIYLKTWDNTQTHIAFWTLELHSCFFVIRRTHMAVNSLPFQKPWLCCVSSSFSWGMGLIILVLWYKFKALGIRFLAKGSWIIDVVILNYKRQEC
jgi:hypothetical protein